MKHSKRIIISLGGSLVVPRNIDTKFVINFKSLIESYIKKGKQFVIVVGGGATARNYQNAAKNVTTLHRDDVDWLGIHSTRINAHFLRTVFKKNAYPHVVTDPRKREGTSSKVIIASGWKPGWSTDYVAVKLAETYNAKTILNISNVNYVYTADPKKNKNAKKIYEISWNDFQKIVGRKWIPGANLPFDPVASTLARKNGNKVIIMDGKNIKNMRNFLAGMSFKGTIIT